MNTLKVKDYTNTYGLIIVCCSFPILLGIATLLPEGNLLLAFLVTVAVYATVLTFYIKYLNRKQEEYLICADEQGVTFVRYGTFKWDEIASIYSFTQRVFGSRREHKYIKVLLNDGQSFSIAIENCDYEYDDIAQRLNKIGHLVDSSLSLANKIADKDI